MILLIVLVSIFSGIEAQAVVCNYNFSNAYWDLSPLRKNIGQNDWAMSQQGWNYKFNYCSNTVGGGCSDPLPAYLKFGSSSKGTCIPLGILSTMNFSPIVTDPNNPQIGIKLTYNTGKLCESGSSYEGVTINNYCDATVDQISFLSLTPYQTLDCTCVINVSTKYGCPSFLPSNEAFLSLGSWLLIMLVSVMVLYLALGVAYNMHYAGESGLQAIPNFEFWKTIPSLVKDGAWWSFIKVSSLARRGRADDSGSFQQL